MPCMGCLQILVARAAPALPCQSNKAMLRSGARDNCMVSLAGVQWRVCNGYMQQLLSTPQYHRQSVRQAPYWDTPARPPARVCADPLQVQWSKPMHPCAHAREAPAPIACARRTDHGLGVAWHAHFVLPASSSALETHASKSTMRSHEALASVDILTCPKRRCARNTHTVDFSRRHLVTQHDLPKHV